MSTCKEVLTKAFNMKLHEPAELMDANPGGFWITCRPSQFARFIVYRHEAGECVNGIKDLKPKIVKHRDIYDYIVEEVCGFGGKSYRRLVKDILEAAARIEKRKNGINVGERPHDYGCDHV